VSDVQTGTATTKVPARLDRLPWSRWHRDALGEQADGVDLRTVQGLAGRKLVETAGQAGAELVVLANRGGLTMLPGTVSQYVLRNAPCPVLVVPENGRGKSSS
jgi:hypothetical protein